jgi:hypothetical protein
MIALPTVAFSLLSAATGPAAAADPTTASGSENTAARAAAAGSELTDQQNAAAATASLKFVAVGDWGGPKSLPCGPNSWCVADGVTKSEWAVARSVGAAVRRGEGSFGLLLGDNFYPGGGCRGRRCRRTRALVYTYLKYITMASSWMAADGSRG